uniref:PiggyBac transposable element-derived protein domain-containing protein n=1 Tax=Ditylenchus dipsaci TaxID=166011 RepID=A0A915CY16_9BILA
MLWNMNIGRECIRNGVARNRFYQILRFLRFDDAERRRRLPERRDKLAPIRIVFESFNVNLRRAYTPSECVTVAEQLTTFRGRCPFRQYIPSEPGKYVIQATFSMRKFYTGRDPQQSREQLFDDSLEKVRAGGFGHSISEQVQTQKADKARKRQFTRSLTLSQVKDYFEMNKKVPADENQPYAVSFKHRAMTVRDDDGVEKPSAQFYLVITANKLQRRQATWSSIQVDGTYKLMTLCYSLLVNWDKSTKKHKV